MSSEKTVNLRNFFIGMKQSFPLLQVPVEVETVETPATVMHLLSTESQQILTEGSMVTCGQPLCKNPVAGHFASVTGLVRRVMPWDGGLRGRFTAVVLERTDSEEIIQLVEPYEKPHELPSDELRHRCALFGFRLPQSNDPLLVMATDEDIDRCTNRWHLEKESELMITGLEVLCKLYSAKQIFIVIPDNVNSSVKKAFSSFGTVITLRQQYPDVLSRLIINRNRQIQTGSKVMIIDNTTVVSIAASLISGTPPVKTMVSVRNGDKRPPRLFKIPVGISVKQLCIAAKIILSEKMQIVLGGELSGTSVAFINQPIMPGDGALLIRTDSNAVQCENSPCVNCGRCSRVCPVALRVDLIGKSVEYSRVDELRRLGIDHCINCGLCTAVCIVGRPLAHLCEFGKELVAEKVEK